LTFLAKKWHFWRKSFGPHVIFHKSAENFRISFYPPRVLTRIFCEFVIVSSIFGFYCWYRLLHINFNWKFGHLSQRANEPLVTFFRIFCIRFKWFSNSVYFSASLPIGGNRKIRDSVSVHPGPDASGGNGRLFREPRTRKVCAGQLVT